MKLLRLLSFPLILALFGLPMFHAPQALGAVEPPDVLIKRVSVKVLNAVKADPEIRKGNRARIEALVASDIAPHIDFGRMTALAAGQHWRTATPDQQRRLTEEFSSLLVHTYSGALAQASDQQIEVRQTRVDQGEAEVVAEIQSARGSEPVRLSYKMAQGPDGWRVFDIGVLGVSLVQTYRGNFATEIGRSGMDGLIAALSERNKQLAAKQR